MCPEPDGATNSRCGNDNKKRDVICLSGYTDSTEPLSVEGGEYNGSSVRAEAARIQRNIKKFLKNENASGAKWDSTEGRIMLEQTKEERENWNEKTRKWNEKKGNQKHSRWPHGR